MVNFNYAISSLIDTMKYCTLNTDYMIYMPPYLSESGAYPFRDKIYEKNENKFYDKSDEETSSEDEDVNKLFTPVEEHPVEEHPVEEHPVEEQEEPFKGDSLPYPKTSVEELDKEMDDYWEKKEIDDIKCNHRSILYSLIEELP